MAAPVPENLKARMKASYDAIAVDYATKFTNLNDPIRLEYLGRLYQYLQEGDKSTAAVLELGCGAGVPATKSLLQNEKPLIHVTGNDISTSQLELARSNLVGYEDRFKLMEGDMLALSFPDSAFDVVTGFYSIVHLPRSEQTQIMHKVGKWVKPGGFFLANFSARDFVALEQDRWLDHDEGWMFWSGWGEEGSVKMVEDAGFDVLSREVRQAVDDARFVWILARKRF